MADDNALEALSDPLITPLLALMKDAINADVRAQMVAAGKTPEDAVVTTAPHPVALEIAGQAALPLLSCYRVRSRQRSTTMYWIDSVDTLQFAYVTPQCAREQIDERWPLLQRVWRRILITMQLGCDVAHLSGADVFGPAGVIAYEESSASKVDLFAETGDYAYPMFRGEMEVIWRDDEYQTSRTAALFPALSIESDLFVAKSDETLAAQPDVRVLSPQV